jgi:hypothetical protein
MKIIVLTMSRSSPNILPYPHLTRVFVGRVVPKETLIRIIGSYFHVSICF